MSLFVEVYKNTYRDSLGTLQATFVASEVPGVKAAYVGMATDTNKATMAQLDMRGEKIERATANDLVVAVLAESEDAFANALKAVKESENAYTKDGKSSVSYPTLESALRSNPKANICTIAVPGEYALAETKKALEAGLHCIVFSNNVSFEDERAMKELAREKGLLCMGPDCGVANINGVAFVLASINTRGPFGICGASGCGIQHVAAICHQYGSGISQGIGTGGSDLKDPIGGISMLMGIDALEKDPDTKYIVLVSRKPGERILKTILQRIQTCKKPVVVFMMGTQKEEIEASGAIWAANLDDCAAKALSLIGKEVRFTSDEEILKIAEQAVAGMSPVQKYVRGAYLGGTYCDEAMRTMREKIGDIYSNCPLSPELQLKDSYVSVKNTVIDYGEEEFTRGKPHPTIDPSVRQPAFMREAADPEVAVILMDMILCAPGPLNPAGAIIADIQKAQAMAKARGGKLVIVASVLGTDKDFQNAQKQAAILQEAGVLVCQTNYRAALLAGEIIHLKKERDAQ